MNPDELQRTLSALHSELSQATEVDEATRHRLREVIAEIDRLIGRSDRKPPLPDDAESPFVQKLQSVVSDFEVRHPQLTASLQQLIDRLAEIGI